MWPGNARGLAIGQVQPECEVPPAQIGFLTTNIVEKGATLRVHSDPDNPELRLCNVSCPQHLIVSPHPSLLPPPSQSLPSSTGERGQGQVRLVQGGGVLLHAARGEGPVPRHPSEEGVR